MLCGLRDGDMFPSGQLLHVLMSFFLQVYLRYTFAKLSLHFYLRLGT